MSHRLRQGLEGVARAAVLALAGFLFMSSLALLGSYTGRTPHAVETMAIERVRDALDRGPGRAGVRTAEAAEVDRDHLAGHCH